MDLRRTAWRKASQSTENGGHCVELADFRTAVGVRDSKAPGGGALLLDRAVFHRLANAIKEL
ncbi:DUF397 domain-containing protein [Actinomadura parmotrematis]|uniref:DUF397 domain-containing protein n=1 Tax=Actinomadura parmotrematis TaxID=2864039 RepID=A0ABS7FXR4_9ACTN|nr:DUF397 domain-containing protein [Actinomadura parmotrematis]MBW8484238.1 DUF397 domain-containing protein [Actinomadura parmotrematis]